MKHQADILESIYSRLYEVHGVIMQSADKHYGFYQLCPKCDGEGVIPDKYAEEEDPPFCTCPICNGAKLLVRPEIK